MKINFIKVLLTNLLVLFVCVVLQGQERFTFRFPPQSDSFTGGYSRNGSEMDRLKTLINWQRSDIQRGTYSIYIDGYAQDEMTNARINKILLEMINIFRLPQSSFRVQTQVGGSDRDAVTVSIRDSRYASGNYPQQTVPQTTYPQQTQQTVPQETYPQRTQQTVPQQTQQTVPQQTQQTTQSTQPVRTQPINSGATFDVVETGQNFSNNLNLESSRKISIRTNMLYLFALLPNLGIEYKPVDRIGLLFNFGYSDWGFKENQIRHIITLYNPEVRYYLGQKRNFFVGGEFHAGNFDMKFKEEKDGNNGDLIGGGLTAGYRAFLSPTFDMDFSIGAGYTRLEYQPYGLDGVTIDPTTIKVKEVFGPTNIGVSLIWKLGRKY